MLVVHGCWELSRLEGYQSIVINRAGALYQKVKYKLGTKGYR